jgi:glycine cleavage system H lipoate-binding protein
VVTLTFVAVLVSVFLLDLLVIRPWEARRPPDRVADPDAELEFAVPRGVFFHPGHVWARFDADGEATVGIDDLVRTVVGNLSAVELPSVGDHLIAGRPAMVIRQGERRLRLVAPLSGRVTASNHALGRDSVRLRWRPYKEGWAYRLDPEPGATREIASLRIGKDAAVWMDGELDRLRSLFVAGTFAPPVEGSLARASDGASFIFEREFLGATDPTGEAPA